jgi:hypothetical protein
MISLPSGMEFTFLDSTPSLPETASLSSLSTASVARPRKRNPSTLESTVDSTPQESPSTDPMNSSNDTSRIHKIRIVEKLLNHNPLPSPISPNLFNHTESSEDDWLDDKSVSLLSSSDLEKLMDRYLFNVVNQLVQLAISDDDLKAELDHLDSRSLAGTRPYLPPSPLRLSDRVPPDSGYSLLHYCCLFNLTSLVEILLSKVTSVPTHSSSPPSLPQGANINLVTGSGSTALHLAAGEDLDSSSLLTFSALSLSLVPAVPQMPDTILLFSIWSLLEPMSRSEIVTDSLQRSLP